MTPIESLAWSQLWQVTIVASALGWIARSLSRRRVHLAYLLWMVVLVKALTPPLWSSPSGVFSWLRSETAAAEIPNSVTAAQAFDSDDQPPPVALASRATDLDAALGGLPAAGFAPAHAWRVPATAVVRMLWLLGAVGVSLVVVVRWLRLQRARRKWSRPDPAIEVEFVRLAQRLKLRRRVDLKISDDEFGPAAVGILRPCAVIPRSLVAHGCSGQLATIVAHELIHHRRCDPAMGLLQTLAQIAWWFHPCIWWANREMSRVCERCCDEEVIANLGCVPTDYVRALLGVLESKRTAISLFTVPGLHRRGVTATRLEDLIHRRKAFRNRASALDWILAFVTAALLLPGAAFVWGAVDAGADDLAGGSGLFYKLPPDGTWARYRLHFEGAPAGESTDAPETITVSSVGQVQIDGLSYRWIETRLESSGASPPVMNKLLIAEEVLRDGADPIGRVVAGWSRRGDEHPRRIANLGHLFDGCDPVDMLWPGPLAEKTIGRAEAESDKLGRLDCTLITGWSDQPERGKENRLHYRTLLSAQAPFGVVECRIDAQQLEPRDHGRDRSIKFALVDFGTGAESMFAGAVDNEAAAADAAPSMEELDALRARSQSNVKRIGLALHLYRDVHGRFPPPVLIGSDGKTPYSWRVALLPYFGLFDATPLKRRLNPNQPVDSPENRKIVHSLIEERGYKLDEPWDSDHNRRFASQIPEHYRDPGAPVDSNNTAYLALSGAETAFGDGGGTSLANISDGTGQTIMFVESKSDVPWTKPADISYDHSKPLPKLGGIYPHGYHVGLADGSWRFVPAGVPEKTLRALITKAGGERLGVQYLPTTGIEQLAIEQGNP